MTPHDIRTSFWFGTHYYRPPTPLAGEWEDDLRRIRDLGLEIIQFRTFWCCCEPREGEYRWDDFDRLMDLCARFGLRGVHQITLENAPAYIFDRYEGYRIDQRGNRMWPTAHAAFYPGGWIPCFDHPVVMERGLEFVRRLVDRYRRHPALAFWHAWNEPRSRPMGECACPHSVASYRGWLEQQFGDIGRLNAAYGKYWPDFASVDAARDTSDFAEMHLWRRWAASRVHARVQAVAETVRGLDPEHAVISHVGLSCMQQDPLTDISDDLAVSTAVDLYGGSFEMRYLPARLEESMPFLVCDWLRHVCQGPFTIYEIYPSRGRFEPEVPPEQLQQWLWIPPACGAVSTFLWQFKKERLGQETNDAGLMETNGDDNPNSLAARETFGLYHRLAGAMAGWRVPPARIALVYDLSTDLLNRLAYTTAAVNDNAAHHGLRVNLPSGHPYKTNLHGWHYLLWHHNVQFDLLAADRLEEAMGQYDLIFLPGLEQVDHARVQFLLRLAAAGATLVADASFANRDGNTWLHTTRPAAPLAAALGWQEARQEVNPALCETVAWLGLDLPVTFQATRFRATPAATVMATWGDGMPAVLGRTIGQGAIWELGFAPGLCALTAADPAPWLAFAERLLRLSGVASAFWGDAAPADSATATIRELVDAQGARIRFLFRRVTARQDAWNALLARQSGSPIVQFSHTAAFTTVR